MKRTALFILSVGLFTFLCISASQAMEFHAGAVMGETVISGHGPGNLAVAAMSSQNNNKVEEPADGVRNNTSSNQGSHASKTGKTIMTLFLITLMVIGLSIYPMLLISRAAKTMKEQMKKDKE